MTDEEQIKCKYKFQDKEKFDGKPYCTCFCELCEDLPLCDDNCQIYEDFKQLTNKTLEYEKYKKLAADFKDVNKQLGYKYLTIKQECEDLREALKKEVIYKRTYLKSLLDCKEECEALKSESFTREELISMQEKDIDRYRKALDEIEKISHYGTFKCVDCVGFNCRACTKEQFEIILNIINKTKEIE